MDGGEGEGGAWDLKQKLRLRKDALAMSCFGFTLGMHAQAHDSTL